MLPRSVFFALAVVVAAPVARAQDLPAPPPVATPAPPPAPPVVPSTAPGARPVQRSQPNLVDPAAARRDANLRLRLRLLGDDLTTLDQRSYTGRYVDAISSIIIGGALIAIGAAVEDLDDSGRRLLYFSGTVSAAEGALSLAFVPSMGDDALRFAAMPDEERRDARRKLRFGERALEDAASEARTDRLVNAFGGMGLGVAYFGALPFLGFTGDGPQIIDYLLIAYAAVVVVQGVISLLSRTPAERMWEVYQQTARAHPAGRRRGHALGPQPSVIAAF